MRIQEKIENCLDASLKSKEDVRDLRFLKAELQRGKSKISPDPEAIKILVKILNDQKDLISHIQQHPRENDDLLEDITGLIERIKSFLPRDINAQLDMGEEEIQSWIQKNVDVSKLKSYKQVIGIVKKEFPFVDGNKIVPKG